MNYKTTETYEAALFKALAYPFIGTKKIDRPNGKTAIEFEFDVPSLSTVQNIIKDYFNILFILSINKSYCFCMIRSIYFFI